ncbi:3-phosphoshikimate 1-carboxyvinyltransferase [Rubrobacter tropicus]|uniref:3-phosphoshikimate 1-carboxyvinyltransferase n=1 Tax=Rubrobacter tropicus TaxID=2653851 RepID=A0A6G8Q950_9ACTN|nr:3-phosphoshikimate 1-carboxyvinyltransferase [Rubrobacter tropicus]QIN83014.1 3-phosphoshikimate 1-carboxyvinyltransferase [Rubrobacter tropicus]
MKPVRGVPGIDFGIREVRGDFPEELEISPLGRPVDAEVRVPGSKSVTNRALLVAALADGVSVVRNPLFSDDPYYLLDALVRLGFDVGADREAGEVRVGGLGGEIPRGGVEVFVGNAGTVARFLPPALALGPGPYTVDGVPRMRERPIRDLVDALRRLGAAVDYAEDEGRFPLVVRGGGLEGGATPVQGAGSSQFVSGLLMAAPYARRTVNLDVQGREKWPYVGITVEVMRRFGVEVGVSEDLRSLAVEPGVYRARAFEVEPDASAASYFMALAAVTGGRVRVPGLGSRSSQGDLRFAEVLETMGCEVEIEADAVEVRGTERLRGVEVDMNAFSDTMMTLAAIAPFASTPTTITNVGHARHQETDRISAVAAELGRLGVAVEERPDGLKILPGPLRPAVVETYGDHRVAMAFAVAGLASPDPVVTIRDPGCVTKTFPGYFGALESLR